MGYIKHHAIIVTSWDRETLNKVHAHATSIFGKQVSNICNSSVNSYETFLIGPDGSSEGWDKSDIGDQNRFEFISYLQSYCYGDGSSMIKFVELSYADEDGPASILNGSNE